MHWNAEGVFHKVEELRNILVEKDIDICCIQETHLTEAKKTLKSEGIRNLSDLIEKTVIRVEF